MCEYCTGWKVWGEPLEDPEEHVCQWIGDEAENFQDCDRYATCLVFEKYVEDHLCEEHVEQENQMLDAGFGDFLRSSGLQQHSADFLPIQKEAACDYIDPSLMVTGESLTVCGKKATHAKMVIEIELLCDGHAAEMGYASP